MFFVPEFVELELHCTGVTVKHGMFVKGLFCELAIFLMGGGGKVG